MSSSSCASLPAFPRVVEVDGSFVSRVGLFLFRVLAWPRTRACVRSRVAVCGRRPSTRTRCRFGSYVGRRDDARGARDAGDGTERRYGDNEFKNDRLDALDANVARGVGVTWCRIVSPPRRRRIASRPTSRRRPRCRTRCERDRPVNLSRRELRRGCSRGT